MDKSNDNTQRILRQAEAIVWSETFTDLVMCLKITRRALSTVGDLILDANMDPLRRRRIMAHIEAALDNTDGYDFQAGKEGEE